MGAVFALNSPDCCGHYCLLRGVVAGPEGPCGIDYFMPTAFISLLLMYWRIDPSAQRTVALPSTSHAMPSAVCFLLRSWSAWRVLIIGLVDGKRTWAEKEKSLSDLMSVMNWLILVALLILLSFRLVV
jgi:hypothetical protein